MMFRNRSLASCSRSFFMATGRCKWDFPYRFDSPTVAEIGSTWYGASFQRTGVNTECKLLMLAHSFDSWNTIRVTLKTDARNIRSRYAIQRLGATFEGIRRAHLPASNGSIRDTAYFSIIAEEWPSVRTNLKNRLEKYN